MGAPLDLHSASVASTLVSGCSPPLAVKAPTQSPKALKAAKEFLAQGNAQLGKDRHDSFRIIFPLDVGEGQPGAFTAPERVRGVETEEEPAQHPEVTLPSLPIVPSTPEEKTGQLIVPSNSLYLKTRRCTRSDLDQEPTAPSLISQSLEHPKNHPLPPPSPNEVQELNEPQDLVEVSVPSFRPSPSAVSVSRTTSAPKALPNTSPTISRWDQKQKKKQKNKRRIDHHINTWQERLRMPMIRPFQTPKPLVPPSRSRSEELCSSSENIDGTTQQDSDIPTLSCASTPVGHRKQVATLNNSTRTPFFSGEDPIPSPRPHPSYMRRFSCAVKSALWCIFSYIFGPIMLWYEERIATRGPLGSGRSETGQWIRRVREREPLRFRQDWSYSSICHCSESFSREVLERMEAGQRDGGDGIAEYEGVSGWSGEY